MKRYFVPVCTVLGAIGLAYSLWLIFTGTQTQFGYKAASVDPRHFGLDGSSLFFNQKIFFWHVPHALILFLSVFIAGISSLQFLRKRDPKWDDIALAACEVAVVFGAVVLVTGSIWAKAAWGFWWIWEQRLVMSLLLWLTLVGYVLVRRFAGATGDRLAAGISVFCMVGVPFIYVMVGADDNHPKAGPDGTVATLDPAIRGVFWLSFVALLLWFLALVAMRVRAARMEREVRELREQALDAGLFA